MLTPFYDLAVYGGILLEKLKFPINLETKNKSTFFRILNFPLAHGKDLKWLGKNWFMDDLGIPFQLSEKNLPWLTSYFNTKGRISLDVSSGKLYATVNKLRFHLFSLSDIIMLDETFLQNTYGFYDVKDKNVLDVGAWTGDTALYFALHGAKRVIAYDSSLIFCLRAKENIDLNNYKNSIKIVNEKITGKNLRDAIEKFGGYVDLLKMDCEGDEWQIIAEATKRGVLKNVGSISMEVHVYGYELEQMEKLLTQANFKIERERECSRFLGLIMATQK